MNSRAHSNKSSRTKRRSRQRGLSLIELMVALVIGSVLIFGATQVYVDGRNAYATNETVARLQETARYALSVIEPDVRMANYWGLVKGASLIANQAAQTAGVAAVAGWPEVNVCGDNFAADLNTNLQGDNNDYKLSLNNSRKPECDALDGWTTTAVGTADTLTIRRSVVSQVPPASQNGWLQICSNRLGGSLYSDGGACPGAPAGLVSNLSVNAYYVDQNSAEQNGLPSLRRKALVSEVGKPSRFADQEITSGIEDMQVQFGIDPTGTTGIATSYVNADAVPLNAQIVSVRIWLLVRADTPEVGFSDDRVYVYGDRSAANAPTADLNNKADFDKPYQPSLSGDDSFTSIKRYRRLLISRTIQIRNALGS